MGIRSRRFARFDHQRVHRPCVDDQVACVVENQIGGKVRDIALPTTPPERPTGVGRLEIRLHETVPGGLFELRFHQTQVRSTRQRLA